MASTTSFNWETPDDTDLVKDGAAAIRTLGNSIDTSMTDLLGGTTGQVLSKASNTNMDFTWVAVDPLTILDAKGDLISATAADTPARLAVGSNGTVLTADSTTATGLRWATPASGGKVLQVVSATTSTSTSTTGTSFVDTNLTANITPSATTSKILIMMSIPETYKGGGSTLTAIKMNISRNGTEVSRFANFGNYTGVSSDLFIPTAASYLDSPATTSSTTYRLRIASTVSGQGVGVINESAAQGSIILMEIGA